jgi:PPP family 3-phenylpropionic acid transporter
MTPSVRISIYFFAMYGGLGVYFNYYPIFLKNLGFNNVQIGVVHAVLPLVSMAVTPLWGAWADSQSDPRKTLRLLLVLGPLSYTVLFAGDRFVVCLFLSAFLAAFYLPVIPIQDSLALRSVHLFGGDYGRIRVWGSLGFVVPALVLPFFWDHPKMGEIRWFIPGVVFGLYSVAAWILSFRFPAVPPERKHGFTLKGFQLLENKEFLVLMVCVTLARWASTSLEAYQGIFFEQKGVNVQYLALFLALGPLSEVFTIFYSQRWMTRYRAYPLMALCLIALAIRLLVTAYSESLTVLCLIQLTHCLTFGLQYMVTILVVNQLAGDSIRSSAQAIAVIFSNSLARLGGFTVSGVFADSFGYSRLFEIGAAIATVSLVVWLLFYRDSSKTTLEEGVR